MPTWNLGATANAAFRATDLQRSADRRARRSAGRGHADRLQRRHVPLLPDPQSRAHHRLRAGRVGLAPSSPGRAGAAPSDLLLQQGARRLSPDDAAARWRPARPGAAVATRCRRCTPSAPTPRLRGWSDYPLVADSASKSPARSPAPGRCGSHAAACGASVPARGRRRTMLYRWKVRLLKRPRLNLLWRRWRAKQGEILGSYDRLPEFIRNHAPGRSFADIGCMWGVNGEYAFVAEEAGATSVKAVDVFGPTPEFDQKHARARGPACEFVLGDITRPDTLEAIGAGRRGVLRRRSLPPPEPVRSAGRAAPDLPRDADPAHVHDPRDARPAQRRRLFPDARRERAASCGT